MLCFERDCDKGMSFNTHCLVIGQIWSCWGLNVLNLLLANEDELGNDNSVISPFSIHILGVESNKTLACSHIMSRSKSNSN
jgi:hypothetical protein